MATRAMWTLAIVLVIIGVSAGVGRALFIDDLTTRADPYRGRALEVLGITDPLAAERPAEMARMDSRYAAHPSLTLLHVLPGAVFLLLAPLQFSKRVRSRHVRFHRWSGRFLLVLAVATVLPGLYFGLRVPFVGRAEAILIALVGAGFFMALVRGFMAIRRKQIARHREWMIRVFAMAVGISTVRLVAAVMDVVMTPAGFRPAHLLLASMWTGWLLTLGAAELWIGYTRPAPARSPAGLPFLDPAI